MIKRAKSNLTDVATAIVITHASELFGPPNALVDYLNRQKIARLYVLNLPLDIGNNTKIKLSYYGRGHLIKEETVDGSHRAGVMKYYKDYKFVRKYVKQILRQHGQIDLLVGANPLNFTAAITAVPRRRIKKWIYYSVDYSPKRFKTGWLNSIYNKFDAFSVKRADGVFAVTKKAIKARQDIGLMGNYLHTPNGVNELKAIKASNRKKSRFIYVGHLTLTKGLLEVLQAWQVIAKNHKDVRLTIVGSGPDEKRISSYIKKERISGVKMTGHLSHEKTLIELEGADFGFALYNRESSYTEFADPMKVREYIACGVVPIVSDFLEIADDIKNNSAGLVVSKDHNLYEVIESAINAKTNWSKGLKALQQSSTWQDVFEKSFGRLHIKFCIRVKSRVFAVMWNPAEKEISAGGYRRALEILKRFRQVDGQLIILDSNPSLMRGFISSQSQQIVEYGIPKIIRFLEKRIFVVGRTLNWLLSMAKITWYGLKLRSQYDIIYVPYSEILVTSFGVAPLRWLTSKRIVLCNLNTDGRRWAQLAKAFIHNSVARTFTISEDLMHDLMKEGISGPMTINYTGIDLSEIKKVPPQKKIYDAVFIGRHVDTKGVFDYVKMLKELVQDNPSFKLVTAGSMVPEVQNELNRQLIENNLSDNWIYKGVVTEKEKIELIKQAKVLWFLSVMEGWGIVPQEALACHVLPICYDLTVYKESIGNCSAVSFVSKNDWRQAVQAHKKIIKLTAKERAKKEELGASFVEQFDWSNVAKREFDIINQVEVGRTPQEEVNILSQNNETN